MTYSLGIDLGTTYSAAATWRDGRAEIASLGDRGASIPSVVLLREDSSFLTGDAAHRRGSTEPQRVAREFKRRFGDPTPIILGGSPHSAEALTARLLRAIVDDVAEREGETPGRICISHPANWGPYKQDLLQQMLRLAELDQPVEFATEPEAAAVFYASQRSLEPGGAVAVYDLGGGTFDAAIVRRADDGFIIAGKPEGIERLGGVDFDAAVFNHVREALDGKLEELDEEDPAAVAAVARLRSECVSAKEALSSDTDVTIPVLLPNFTTEIRLTRTELETMVRPVLLESIAALRRTMDSAGVAADELDAVLLVGGSSRMPIVAQLISAELGRPVVVDAHPKHAIALGASWIAGGQAGDGSRQEASPVASSGQQAASPDSAASPSPPGSAAPPRDRSVESEAERQERTQLLSAFNARHVRTEPPPAPTAPATGRPESSAPAHPQRWASTPRGQQQPPPAQHAYPSRPTAAKPRFPAAVLVGLAVGLAIGFVILQLLPS